MSLRTPRSLSPLIAVSSAFQRATSLESDLAASGEAAGVAGASDLLRRYVPLGTCIGILERMAESLLHSRQRAFTWTGPYGSGKSSLALMLCSLLKGGEPRRKALERLALNPDSPSVRAFGSGSPWRVIALTGRPGRLADDLAARLECEACDAAILERLETLSKDASSGGALLIIDELGKCLEADCASENAYLLQELAETSNRLERPVLLVGILHQAIGAYCAHLPRALRLEWEKVRGRFVDMPLLGSAEEVISLLSRAIVRAEDSIEPSAAFSESVRLAASEAALRRGVDAAALEKLLARCWPLNPVVTLLLGPVSRRSFSQNERSIYAFLSSREPRGFAEFIRSAGEEDLYSPADYWDYLQANFESSILATPDGHRWMTAADAVERAERKGSGEHVRLAKTLALIDLFRSGAGLEPSLRLLASGMGLPEGEVSRMLGDLVAWRIAIERRYANAWGLFAGSDFNLEAALAEELARREPLDAGLLASLTSASPVIARASYLRTGALAWFARVVLPEAEVGRWIAGKREDNGMTGAFLLILPDEEGDAESRSPEERLEAIEGEHGSVTPDGLALAYGVCDLPEGGGLSMNIKRLT